jgi:hypothetical protein
MMLLGALYPLGAITQGAIADQIGLRATTAGAAILLGLAFGLRMVLRPHSADALAEVRTRQRAGSGSPDPLPEAG